VLRDLFASGRVVELILGLMVLEAAVLIAWRRRTGSGIAPLDLLINLCAGALLLLALRAAIIAPEPLAAAPFLAAALVAHVADLARRWKRSISGR
jgi:hypothetical protein